MKIHFLPKSNINGPLTLNGSGVSSASAGPDSRRSLSSDRIDALESIDHCKIDFPENVLKIYRLLTFFAISYYSILSLSISGQIF